MTQKLTVSPAEIQKIADLSKLHLEKDQLDLYTGQINDILAYVDQLGELDVDNVEPLAHVLDLVYPGRPDEAGLSLKRSKVLANAPTVKTTSGNRDIAADDEFFLVPAVKKTE
ncbi:Asp-tRNA(Asn)/Glu-tRNA(Gln) amidotransferase subunit GatC [Candidatus Neomarinimicrobiota bacterium]